MLVALRRWLPLGAAMLALSCSGVAGDIATAHGQSPFAPHPNRHAISVAFILNGPPDVNFAGIWVAQSKGWFKRAGLKVSWRTSAAPESEVRRRGGNTFGFQTGATLAMAVSKGVPIHALYAATQKPLFALTVPLPSGAYQLSQLRGKRIGYQANDFYVAAAMLSCKPTPDLSRREWRPVLVGNDPSQMTSGHVDAYLARFPREVDSLIHAGVHINTFLAADYCVHFYDNVLFTTNRLIRSNPSVVKKVTAFVARGFQWAFTHAWATASLVAARYFPPAHGSVSNQITQREEQFTEMAELGLLARTGRSQYHGVMGRATWQSTASMLLRYGQVTKRPNMSSIYTNRFNPYKR